MSLLFASLDPSATGVQKVRWHCAKSRSWETVEEIASACGITRDTANGAIQKLLREQLLEKERASVRRSTRRQRYQWRAQE
jgi:predicted transcriptional regulator